MFLFTIDDDDAGDDGAGDYGIDGHLWWLWWPYMVALMAIYHMYMVALMAIYHIYMVALMAIYGGSDGNIS